MAADRKMLRSMLESAAKLKSLQQENLGPKSSERACNECSLNVDALPAQQMGEALSKATSTDVLFMRSLMEDLLDFRETFSVVQHAIERGRKDAVPSRKELLRKQIEAFSADRP